MQTIVGILTVISKINTKFERLKARNFFITPTKRSDAQPLVERENQFECLPVEISRSLKGKQMLHVQYNIINIAYPRKRIENRGMSCNLLRVTTFMV